ncbi:thiamine pyrophosphate-binding protein [Marivita sp. S6314]|uniref:thiamine pyrophosphate-binding protein n=1 Tax=Marivita sp. S6314 TaxID=2926406 RepID=UPI001FF67CA5|nr:thiamine pyrophosphate-binding protein [Marivita sp. S6314]MCK0150521.1 thiamine pyrophosphate-binding protein [Marivita sp. S6314]
MTTQQITVSDYLIRRLREHDVRHIFAVPGDYIGDFLDVVDEADGVERIATVNELEAGFAADGYARSCGLSCVALQYGVGTYSALNAIAGAMRERVPIVLVTGAPSATAREHLESYGIVFHHSTSEDMDVDARVFANVTVATEVIKSAEGAAEAIDRALAEALAQQAPVYIQIWKDVQRAKIDPPTGPMPVKKPPASWPDAINAALDATVARLKAAKHPVFWVGLEMQRLGMNEELSRLIHVSGIPFTTTIQAKGIVKETDPMHFGTFAGAASSKDVIDIMHNADLILELGAIPIDYYKNFVIEKFDQTVSVQRDLVRIGSAKYDGVHFRDFVTALIQRFEDDPSLRGGTTGMMRPLTRPDPDTAPLTYENTFHELNRRLQDETGVFCDLGISMFMGARLEIKRANGFTCQSDWMSLGYAVPGALGFALHDGRPLFAIAGDGSFQMTAQALSTYARLTREWKRDPSFHITILVIDNGTYGLEQCFTGLGAFIEKKDGTGYEENFDDYNLLARWDYANMAESLGLVGVRADTVGDLKTALDDARKNTVPTLIQTKVDKHDLPPELFALVASFKPKQPPPEA